MKLMKDFRNAFINLFSLVIIQYNTIPISLHKQNVLIHFTPDALHCRSRTFSDSSSISSSWQSSMVYFFMWHAEFYHFASYLSYWFVRPHTPLLKPLQRWYVWNRKSERLWRAAHYFSGFLRSVSAGCSSRWSGADGNCRMRSLYLQTGRRSLCWMQDTGNQLKLSRKTHAAPRGTLLFLS